MTGQCRAIIQPPRTSGGKGRLEDLAAMQADKPLLQGVLLVALDVHLLAVNRDLEAVYLLLLAGAAVAGEPECEQMRFSAMKCSNFGEGEGATVVLCAAGTCEVHEGKGASAAYPSSATPQCAHGSPIFAE